MQGEPVKYHWCFYGKLLELEEKLKTEPYVDVRQDRVLKTYQFLVPIAKAFAEESVVLAQALVIAFTRRVWRTRRCMLRVAAPPASLGTFRVRRPPCARFGLSSVMTPSWPRGGGRDRR